MNINTEIDFRNQDAIRRAGMSALKKELGIVGTAYFIRQFSPGYGDYTDERDEFFQGITLDEIINSIEETNNNQST